MLPDYLPIIHVSQFHGDEKIRKLLLDGLRKEIAIKGVRVSVVERLVHYTSGGGVDSGVIENIASTDLLFVNGRCDKDCAQLVLGQHLDTAINETAAYPRFTCPDASQTTVCADIIFRWLEGCMNDTPRGITAVGIGQRQIDQRDVELVAQIALWRVKFQYNKC